MGSSSPSFGANIKNIGKPPPRNCRIIQQLPTIFGSHLWCIDPKFDPIYLPEKLTKKTLGH